ncbi:(2Fe-2S)-binding protein [Affinibrenneria salicis]|nr:(2Fe-2S)-binding protein [Affinibrenneria salicis]
MTTVDVLIVGAGPAGLAAAREAADAGLSVGLVDENPLPGGQIYRNVTASPLDDPAAVFGSDYLMGRPLADRLPTDRLLYLPATQVWQVTPENVVYLLTQNNGQGASSRAGDGLRQVQARFILLCVGALERPLPLPGWTLPGAMTVGAAQLLMKSAGLLPPQDSVLLGNGPLLLLFAAQVIRAGGRIQAIVETTTPRHYLRALRFLAASARHTPGYLLKGSRLLWDIRQAGIPCFTGASALTIAGEQQVEAVEFEHKGRRRRLATGAVFSHAGVIPATQLAAALGCRLRFDEQHQYWLPELDEWQQTSRPGVFVAGDAAGIIGAGAAPASGRLAVLGIIRAAGIRRAAPPAATQAYSSRIAQLPPDRPDIDPPASAVILSRTAALRRELARHAAIRPFLSALYPPPCVVDEPADDVILCRCEQVSVGDIRAAARAGCAGVNQLKVFTRCGMGACQGRICGAMAASILALTRRQPISDAGYFHARFPLKPITLGAIAASYDDATSSQTEGNPVEKAGGS